MMAEIINQRYAACDAFDFHAPLDAGERIERRLNLLILQSAMFRAGDDGKRIPHIQFTHEIDVKLEAGNFKLGGRRAVAKVESIHGVIAAKPKAFHRAMRHVQQRREVRIIAIAEQ